MPLRRSQSRRLGIVFGIVAVLVGLALLVGLSFASGSGKVELSNLGDRDFRVGNTERLAAEIADRGPFLIPDGSPNRARDLYVQHLGDDRLSGWVVLLAGTRACPLQWEGQAFVDCEGTESPADGTGLTRYRTRIDDGVLYADLRDELP